MTSFKRGDKVTVTNPVEPTGYTGGETAVVIGVSSAGGREAVYLHNAADDSLSPVLPQEITKK
ncbi:hypothetical protein ACFVAF_25360 [Streptomyces sp. NPDC057596]|uniref:hypothetical protein n=1 Tax=Streptomyces sp. NPDC057596 TaxID=3346178 RepID=UPI003698E164